MALHPLLRRQLRRHFGSEKAVDDRWRPFVSAVDRAYHRFDEEHRELATTKELPAPELMQANAALRTLFTAFPDLFLRLDPEGRILDVKGGHDVMQHPETLVGQRLRDLPLGELGERVGIATQALREGKDLVALEYALLVDDVSRHYEARLVSLPDDEVMVIVRDVSERAAIEAEAERRRSLLQSTLDSATDGILVVDLAGRIVSCNRRFAQLWRVPPEVLRSHLDRPVLEFAAGEVKDPRGFLAKVDELHRQPEAESRDVVELKDGRVFERTSQPQSLDGRPVGRVWSFRDVTMQKRVEEQLVYQAVHDQLTGMHNRVLFVDRLELAIRRTKRHPERSFAVLFVDLDRFKVVNDSLGHLVGDELLVAVAERLRTCVRPEDTVARLGGDEFTVLLEEIHGPEGAVLVAERIQEAMRLPFAVGETEVFTTASIGIAPAAAHYTRAEEVLRDADLAMYRAKAQGKARHELFDARMHASAVALLELESDLRRAADRDQLRLHYQPIVDLASGELFGFEALLRWEHPQRGLVYPDDFVAVAEDTGLIVPMGWWALAEACRQMNQWQTRWDPARRLSISVNLSGRQFTEPELLTRVSSALQASSLPPRCLALEITESVVMENSDVAIERLEALRVLGVQIHIDDFGTGYSSLSYLHRFPIDTLKIDRSFVGRIGTHGEHAEIVRTITRLALNLGLKVIAEGVETAEQRLHLRNMLCHYGQGYHFSEPADDAGALAMIAAERKWAPPPPEPRMRVVGP